MNAIDLADALRRHRLGQERPRPKRRKQRNSGGPVGRPRQTPRLSETELRALHTRHANRETIISLAGGDEAVRVMLCREFKRRGWPVYRWYHRLSIDTTIAVAIPPNSSTPNN